MLTYGVSDGVSLWVLNQDNVLWQEGEKYFGFGNGVSIYFNREKYTDVFCFYGKSTDHHLNQLYINHIDELKQFCQYFLFKAMPIIKRNKENRLQTPDKYTRKDSRCDKFDLSKKIINMPGHATSGIRLRNKNSLSERELLCVQLSAQGYTAQQIANDAALSRRTVETYINNAKNKFGCNNLCELVYYCVKNAIIV